MTKNHSIAKSATLVTIMMLSFKVLGFVKQAVIAYYYGATLQTDTYFIAWGFISGVSEAIIKALIVSIVAIYTSLRVQKGKHEAAKLVNGLVEVLFPVFLLFNVFLIGSAPFFSKILAPSYDYGTSSMLTVYIRVLAPVMLFSSVELVFGAVLDSNKSFFVPRLQSFIYSLSTIIACIFLSAVLGVKALIISQYISYLLFTLLVIIAANKYHSFFITKIDEIPELKSILITAIPLFIGNSALQINQIVDKSITSGLGEGAASALSYCHTLEQFVTNIMIVNIGNMMFVNFAELVAKNQKEELKEKLNNSINVLIVILLFISIITITSSRDIVSTVYERGNFSDQAVQLTSIALVGYAISFVVVGIRDLIIKSLYSFKDTKLPMISSLLSIGINIVLSILLSRKIGILGISLATSISAFAGATMCSVFIKLYIENYKFTSHLKLLLQILPAGICCSIVAILLHKSLIIGSFFKLCITTIGTAFVYIIVLLGSKGEELSVVKSLINRKGKEEVGSTSETTKNPQS